MAKFQKINVICRGMWGKYKHLREKLNKTVEFDDRRSEFF